jgi:uncharacterized protein (DUF1499 family)
MWWKWLLLVAALAVLLPVLALAALSLFARRPGNLGVKDGKLATCPAAPNCVSSQAEDAEHRAEPLRFQGEPAQAWKRLRDVLATLPRVDVVTAEDRYLHAEFTSLLFRFVDDVEFVLDPENRVIHFRSASRAGYSDMGANRARMEAIRTAWERGIEAP